MEAPELAPAAPLPRPLAVLVDELAAGYELVEEWSSRTSRLSRFRAAGRRPEELVVKVCPRWTAAEARTSFEAARRFAPLAGERVRAIEFVAWSEEPPALVSEYVAGEELGALLRRATPAAAAELRGLVAAAGGLLGRAHRLPIPSGVPTKPPGRRPRRRVLSAGDFASYNFRLDAGGTLVFLEPPSALRAVAAYRDLSWFLASLDPLLAGRRGLARSFRRAFLAAYRAACGAPWGPLDALHLWLHLWRRRRAMARRMRRRETRRER
ncbi:MAG TPA: hypothetical protein VHM02_04850 [Thermoanaerobaculia bacterium]|nr:hypothetical protein [Thermoanaerobaculia bacterium]